MRLLLLIRAYQVRLRTSRRLHFRAQHRHEFVLHRSTGTSPHGSTPWASGHALTRQSSIHRLTDSVKQTWIASMFPLHSIAK